MKKGSKLQDIVLAYYNGEDNMSEIMANIEPMIVSLVMKYKCKCEYEDLIQTGWVAVLKCLNNYNAESGVLFSTYCYKAISNDLIYEENRERKHLSKYTKDGECEVNLMSKDIEFEGSYGTKSTFESIIPNDEWEVSKQVIFKELTPEVYKLAETLNPSPRRVVLDYLAGKRQCDIAREMGVTYAYVSKVIINFITLCQNEFNK